MRSHLTRRHFLAASSTACAAAACQPRWALAADPNDPGGAFATAVQTISLPKFALPGAVGPFKGWGVRYVEFSASPHPPATASDEQIATTRQLAAAAGMTITAQGVNRFSSDHAA